MTEDVIARTRCTTARRLTAVGAVTTALLLAAAGVLVVSRARPTPAPPASTTPQASQPTTGSSGAGSDLPDDMRWIDVAGVAVPVSSRHGPFDTSAGLARGFSHDRGGAVLAAVHLALRVAPQVGADIFNPTLASQVVGPDVAAMQARVSQEYDDLRGQAQAGYGGPVGELPTTLRGYRVNAFTPGEASVELLTETSGEGEQVILAASSVRLSWTGSDWALIAPPGGSFDSSVALVTDASRFVDFPGGR